MYHRFLNPKKNSKEEYKNLGKYHKHLQILFKKIMHYRKFSVTVYAEILDEFYSEILKFAVSWLPKYILFFKIFSWKNSIIIVLFFKVFRWFLDFSKWEDWRIAKTFRFS
jgi:hypothetical protein